MPGPGPVLISDGTLHCQMPNSFSSSESMWDREADLPLPYRRAELPFPGSALRQVFFSHP